VPEPIRKKSFLLSSLIPGSGRSNSTLPPPFRELRLLAPNRFVLQWVKDRFTPRIEALGAEFFSSPIRVSLTLEASPAPEPARSPEPAARAARSRFPSRPTPIAPASFRNSASTASSPARRTSSLAPRRSRSRSTRAPLTTLCSSTAASGLGKTHLIHAVGNLVLQQHPSARVRYLHAAQYISDVIRAYQQKSFDEFSATTIVDLLLIDDIQSSRARPHPGGVLLRFNALIESHKQLIITCDTYPKDLAGIDERLKSRFSWGLTWRSSRPARDARGHHPQEGWKRSLSSLRGSRVLHRQAHPLQRARAEAL